MREISGETSSEKDASIEECEGLVPATQLAVKKQKESPNWIGIEAQYRLGLLSNVQIAQNYGITEGAIRKMAKKYRWVKDLSSQVREKVRDKLVRAEIRGTNVPDEQIVEQAATRAFEIVQLHRKDVAKQREIAAKLLEELENNPTTAIVVGKGENQSTIAVPVSLKERSEILRNLSQAAARYIMLERQAFGIDGEEEQKRSSQGFSYERFLASIVLRQTQDLTTTLEVTGAIDANCA
jgi:hypothetical protein